MLAKFACDPKNSVGRLYPESSLLAVVSPYELDRSRIIESNAFRRLDCKTQVFIGNEGDHYRNRLTHSLEAAQIARIVSKALHISTDLAENLALAHDLGHAPFGHAGEDALKEVMQEYGEDFDHNSHTIKLLTKLEKKYPMFDGLNLSWETIEGIVKHNGPLLNPSKIVLEYSEKHDLDLVRYSSLEAQVSSLSDDVAYNNHDIDDGFRAGLINIEELREISIIGKLIDLIKKEHPRIEADKVIHETVQRMKHAMITDLIDSTRRNIKKFSIETIEDVRSLGRPLARFSDEMEQYNIEIKKFLMLKVYRSSGINRMSNKAKRIIKELFHLYMNDLGCLPQNWQINLSEKGNAAILVCDFIACMSDRYAMAEYRSFFELS
jgi:dGTPase